MALYIEALAEEGFESIISGGSVFALAAPEVQLIEALIAVVADKRASSDLYTVLSSPLFNLGDEEHRINRLYATTAAALSPRIALRKPNTR